MKLNSKIIKMFSNFIVLLLFFVSLLVLFKYSSLPNVFGLLWFEKPRHESSIIVSLATSFIVTAVFYFVMNYMPDYISELEEKERVIPRRKIVQREVHDYIEIFIKLWEDVVKTSYQGYKAKSVDDLFGSEKIAEAVNNLNLNAASHIPLVLPGDLRYASWKDVFLDRLSKMVRKGEMILDRYSYDIPEEVALSIYTMQNSFYCGHLSVVMRNLGNVNTDDFRLSTCIVVKDGYLYDKESLIDDVGKICVWVNQEYEYIESKAGPKGILKTLKVTK